MEQLIGGGAAADAQDLIKDTDTQNFQADVLDASMDVPVIVDFWAPWCGPCKQLGPLLEKLVTEARGKVKLVKLNVDENQALAQQFRVQSIPAVFAFFGGRPVDGFVGALPESQLRQFIDKLGQAGGPSPIDEAVAQAKAALNDGNAEEAAGIFAAVLKEDPSNIAAAAGLARAAVALGEVAQARQILSQIPTEHAGNADVEAAYSAVELAEQAADAGDARELEAVVAENPDDHQARYDLAVALYTGGKNEAAIENLLEIIRRDREWNDDEARKQLLKIFEALGPTHPDTVKGRRGLSSILFS